MRRAMDETERRRRKQTAHNAAYGIVPQGVVKKIKDIIDGVYDMEEAEHALRVAQERAHYEALGEKELTREIKRLEKDMLAAAKNLEFERAAQLRDQMNSLKKLMFGVEEHDQDAGIVRVHGQHLPLADGGGGVPEGRAGGGAGRGGAHRQRRHP
jgi:excinuclease ABC subunit B